VIDGQTNQQWYPLMGREANKNENQGDILIIMSFLVNILIRKLKILYKITLDNLAKK
jgi:hypothetical protein